MSDGGASALSAGISVGEPAQAALRSSRRSRRHSRTARPARAARPRRTRRSRTPRPIRRARRFTTSSSCHGAASRATRWMPAVAGIGSNASREFARQEARSASRAVRAYALCMRRRCFANSPSSMNVPSAVCVSMQLCQSPVLLRRPERLRQRRGRHHVADPQVGKKRLRKRADIRDEPRAVQTLQRFHRPSLEAEFAVVIVLDDHRAAPLRPFEQFDAPLEAHRHAERKLMRRRHVDEPRVPRQPLDDDALAIHRHMRDASRRARRTARAPADSPAPRPRRRRPAGSRRARADRAPAARPASRRRPASCTPPRG